MKKFLLDLDEDTHQELKREAVDSKETMQEVITEAIKELLARRKQERSEY